MSRPTDDKSPHPPNPDNRILFQRIFEELAADMPLNVDGEVEENRMVGVALVPAAHSSKDTTSAQIPAKASDSDQAAIEEILTLWETLHPEDLLERWREVATEPFIAIGPGWIKEVDDRFIKDWFTSPAFRKLIENYQPFNPRRTAISNVNIVHIGHSLASVTYQAEEETKAKNTVGNGGALVMKTKAGWRIAAVARYDQLQHDGSDGGR